jgi:hypothetical protein
MRHLMLARLLLLVVVAAASVSCGGDDGSCSGSIVNHCSSCECGTGKTTTCTGYPNGSTTSGEFCCSCS